MTSESLDTETEPEETSNPTARDTTRGCDPVAESTPAADRETGATDRARESAKRADVPGKSAKPIGRQTISLSLRSVIAAAVLLVLLAVIATTTTLWLRSRGELHDRDAAAADRGRAEQVATDYAVGAAKIDFTHVDDWFARLKDNTAPELAAKFDATAPKLRDILLPLKWTSTATPITAKTMSEAGGVYKVDVFLTVSSTNAQTPDGGRTTVTYTVTVDRHSGWKITDVGGLEGALAGK